MKITPRNLVNHELIGLKVKVKRCRNQQLVKFEGLVVDETRNMLAIRSKGKVKFIPKDIAVFHFFLPEGELVEVDGKVLVGRPEDRLKIKVKYW